MDQDWCIGCGVCAIKCEYDALSIVYREDKKQDRPEDFEILHKTIQQEKV